MTFKSNYSSTFTVWDHVFGTDVKVRNQLKSWWT